MGTGTGETNSVMTAKVASFLLLVGLASGLRLPLQSTHAARITSTTLRRGASITMEMTPEETKKVTALVEDGRELAAGA